MANPVDSFVPEERFSADIPVVTFPSTLKAGQNVAELTVLMRDATTKELVKHAGTAPVAGIAAYAVDATAGAQPITCYKAAALWEDQVIFDAAITTTLAKQALLDGTGIVLHTSNGGY